MSSWKARLQLLIIPGGNKFERIKDMFDKHKGQWEVLQLPNNVRAQKFWKSVISEYTNGGYKECGSVDAGWIGFLFDNSSCME